MRSRRLLPCAIALPWRLPVTEDPLAGFDYDLPPEHIAQQPVEPREAARLLVLSRPHGLTQHSTVSALTHWLRAGDLLVVNTTRVLPARLRGIKEASGGRVEALLLGPDASGSGCWRALLRARGRLRAGLRLRFGAGAAAFDAELCAVRGGGEVLLQVADGVDPYRAGEPPLPPYIRRPLRDRADDDRYQTVFATVPGAVAAPTAGLHLGSELLAELDAAGIERADVVLHVGPGTFRPLCRETFIRGALHAEPFELPPATADAVARTRGRGGRVIAVGTTTTRVLEACASGDRQVAAGRGETDLFLRPGSRFQVIDGLLTNFHLPRSSLLLLVAAFAGREAVLSAYAEAIARGYRFYSYGDAMLVL
ncbi:tRNA preQ1(34) S-adenosylmethionine ribosyltransferase-isomerase QueA [Myxococcota bacterium]|nr:tRNA preQ1(34) S-adenosylmethionine ribosyltransferase-isomerase QueA [Myxococcota bacterium]